MRILVIGASRGVGRLVVQQALDAGHNVTAFARDLSGIPDLHKPLRVLSGDATNEVDICRAVAGHDAVVSALGSDNRHGPTRLYSTAAANLVRGMSDAGISRLVVLSNFGVLSESSWHPTTALITCAVRLAIRDTLADHRLAIEAFKRSNLDWAAVRPMALFDGKHTGVYRVVSEGLPSGGWHISRADVADFMLRQLADTSGQRTPAIAY